MSKFFSTAAKFAYIIPRQNLRRTNGYLYMEQIEDITTVCITTKWYTKPFSFSFPFFCCLFSVIFKTDSPKMYGASHLIRSDFTSIIYFANSDFFNQTIRRYTVISICNLLNNSPGLFFINNRPIHLSFSLRTGRESNFLGAIFDEARV